MLRRVAANHPRLDQSRKDLVSLITTTMTKRSQLAYEKRLAAALLHLPSATVLKKRLYKHQVCWKDGADEKGTYAVCAIQQSTGPFIQEWLTHQLLLGAEKIYLYDNSELGTVGWAHFMRAVQPFMELGLVEIVPWWIQGSANSYQQVEAQRDCFERARPHFKWLAFIDTDEYPVIHEPHTTCMNRFLSSLPDDQGGLVLRWRGFAPLGQAVHDHDKLFLEQYRYEAKHKSFAYLKSIVNVNRTEGVLHAHKATYRHGFVPKDAGGNVVDEWWFPDRVPKDAHKHMELRHYWARDLQTGLYEKVCGTGTERVAFSKERASVLFDLISDGCCTKIDEPTRHDKLLRKVLFG